MAGGDGVDDDMVDDGEGTSAATASDPTIPPGWTVNPSSWSQRIPIVVLALIGTGVSLYLGLYQIEIFASVWEPFFGDGSERVLNSKVSHLLPIPDALLGTMSYLADAVTGVIGGTKRWKSMPWIVILFGLAVGPLGAISILLVILQPVMFDSFCTLCLASAAISLAMIGPAMDEVLASLQYVKRRRSEGRSTWRVFWGLEPTVEDAAAQRAALRGAA